MSDSRLDFESIGVDGLTVCRLLTEFGAGVVERHWDALYRQPLPDRDRNPFFTHGVNNNNREEVALYLGLAWALTDERDRWAIPVDGLEDARTWYGREDFELVRWDYDVDAEQTDWTARDRGFTRASYPVDRRQLRGPASPGAGRPAGVFPVRNRHELTDLLVACLGDVWSTVVVFGVDPDTHASVQERLRDRRRPTLRHVVGQRRGGVLRRALRTLAARVLVIHPPVAGPTPPRSRSPPHMNVTARPDERQLRKALASDVQSGTPILVTSDPLRVKASHRQRIATCSTPCPTAMTAYMPWRTSPSADVRCVRDRPEHTCVSTLRVAAMRPTGSRIGSSAGRTHQRLPVIGGGLVAVLPCRCGRGRRRQARRRTRPLRSRCGRHRRVARPADRDR